MSEFVDTPMKGFNAPDSYKGGPGEYDGCKESEFGKFPRTHSGNGVPEKITDGSVPKPSGESDQF